MKITFDLVFKVENSANFEVLKGIVDADPALQAFITYRENEKAFLCKTK